jgi:hypothetical protein
VKNLSNNEAVSKTKKWLTSNSNIVALIRETDHLVVAIAPK